MRATKPILSTPMILVVGLLSPCAVRRLDIAQVVRERSL
jgi:hypothetical protein